MPDDPDDTNDLVNNLRPDDPVTFNRLIAHTYERLKLLVHSMLRDFGGVRRWDDTDDVLHSALFRLGKAFSESKLELTSARHFYQVAANYIRLELLSRAEKYPGPQGYAANRHTDSTGGAITGAADQATGSDRLRQWANFQLKAKELPPDLREVFNLIWYNGKSQREAADILGVSERTVKRRWLTARLALDKACKPMDFDWSNCVDPARLLEYARDGASERKLRLFAVACCRRIADRLGTGLGPSLLDLAEWYADGLVTDAERRAIRTRARQMFRDQGAAEAASSTNWVKEATYAMFATSARNAWGAVRTAQDGVVECLVCRAGGPQGCNVAKVRTAELARQSGLARDIFIDPVRPVNFNRHWRSADVLGLAEGIYQDRAFDRLPILADALMDAGCDHEEVLGHCRSGGRHARGCWVVDLMLGKK